MVNRYCSKNHPLVRGVPPAWACDACGAPAPKGAPSYGCRDCDVDCCELCFVTPSCRGRHMLVANRVGTAWACNGCHGSRAAGSLAYSCRDCDWDVCAACHDAKMPAGSGSGGAAGNAAGAAPSAVTGVAWSKPQRPVHPVASAPPKFTPSGANAPLATFSGGVGAATVVVSQAGGAADVPTQMTPQPPAPVAATAADVGRHKSLFVGINYPGTQAELRGCVNDVFTMMKVARASGFDLANTRVLVDDHAFPARTGDPDKKSIEDGLKWLCDGARPGDALLFHYSGHGTSMKDDGSDEADGFDEALVPADYQRSGCIRDDWVFKILQALPAGVRLTAVTDCCHSGSICDLEHQWVWEGEDKKFKPRPSVRTRAFNAVNGKACAADVIAFSGCKDSQTSSDVSNVANFEHSFGKDSPGKAGGACTNALAEAFAVNPKYSYMELLFRLQENLTRRKFEQVPQLTTSRKLNADGRFSFFGPLPL